MFQLLAATSHSHERAQTEHNHSLTRQTYADTSRLMLTRPTRISPFPYVSAHMHAYMPLPYSHSRTCSPPAASACSPFTHHHRNYRDYTLNATIVSLSPPPYSPERYTSLSIATVDNPTRSTASTGAAAFTGHHLRTTGDSIPLCPSQRSAASGSHLRGQAARDAQIAFDGLLCVRSSLFVRWQDNGEL